MAVIETSHDGGELTSGNYGQFFAPISSDAVDALVAKYQQARDSIGEIAAYARENMQGIFGYFVSGNVPTDRRFGVTAVENVFLEPGAIAALNSDYWGRAGIFRLVIQTVRSRFLIERSNAFFYEKDLSTEALLDELADLEQIVNTGVIVTENGNDFLG